MPMPRLELNRVKLARSPHLRPTPPDTQYSVHCTLALQSFANLIALSLQIWSGYIKFSFFSLSLASGCSPTRGPFSARFPAATTGTLVGHKGRPAQCVCTCSADLGLPSARKSFSNWLQHHHYTARRR